MTWVSYKFKSRFWNLNCVCFFFKSILPQIVVFEVVCIARWMSQGSYYINVQAFYYVCVAIALYWEKMEIWGRD